MRRVFLVVLLLGMAGAAWAEAPGRAVDVQIRSDSGRILPLYPVATPSANRRVYVEAVKGDHYSILVRNLSEPARRGGDRGGRQEHHLRKEVLAAKRRADVHPGTVRAGRIQGVAHQPRQHQPVLLHGCRRFVRRRLSRRIGNGGDRRGGLSGDPTPGSRRPLALFDGIGPSRRTRGEVRGRERRHGFRQAGALAGARGGVRAGGRGRGEDLPQVRVALRPLSPGHPALRREPASAKPPVGRRRFRPSSAGRS